MPLDALVCTFFHKNIYWILLDHAFSQALRSIKINKTDTVLTFVVLTLLEMNSK